MTQLFAPDIAAQEVEALGLLGVLAGSFTGFLDEGPEDGEETEDERGKEHDERALGLGLPFRFDGLVEHLDDGGVAGFVHARDFVLPGEEFEKHFVVLHVAHLAHVFETDFRHLAGGHEDVALPHVAGLFQFYELGAQAA